MKVTDPVCGMQIDSDTAAATEHVRASTYYFCSASCRDKFRTAPDRYVDRRSDIGKAQSCCATR